MPLSLTRPEASRSFFQDDFCPRQIHAAAVHGQDTLFLVTASLFHWRGLAKPHETYSKEKPEENQDCISAWAGEVQGAAAGGGEQDDGLAGEVIALQVGVDNGGSRIPPDGKAQKDDVIVLPMGLPAGQRRAEGLVFPSPRCCGVSISIDATVDNPNSNERSVTPFAPPGSGKTPGCGGPPLNPVCRPRPAR